MSCLSNNEKSNDNSIFSENDQSLSNIKDEKSMNSEQNLAENNLQKKIFNKKKLKKNKSESESAAAIQTKNKLLDESTIDMLNDDTLDGFSIEENTVLSSTNDIIGVNDNVRANEVDDEIIQDSNGGSQSVVTFNLKDTPAELNENSVSQKTDSNVKKRKRRGSAFYVDQSIASKISAAQLFVYKWPQDEPGTANGGGGGELFMLQEQVSDYLDIKSFKRKYPDLCRRPIDLKEREFLKENKIVSETQCDLGLTALKLSDVLFIMSQEYPDKYKEFNNSLNEKRKSIANTQIVKRKSESFKTNKSLDSTKMKELMKKAIKSASEYNSQLQKERKEERTSFFDLHTMRIQVPKNKTFQLKSELTKPGSYPVSLIHGQYSDYYKKYTSDELKYLPVNTILYNLPKPTPILYWEWKHNTRSSETYEDSSEDEQILETNLISNQNIENVKPTVVVKNEPIVAICYVCLKSSTSDQMIHCSSCPRYSHPSCLELNPKLVDWNYIRNYNWQCMDCKMCSNCNELHDEDKMMFCDRCDRGFHTYCVGVKEVPSGSWFCTTCKSSESERDKQNINIAPKSTPVKMKINSILASAGSTIVTPNTTPAKRGRPVGSLNKPKISQPIKDIKLIKDVTQKNTKLLLKDLIDSNNCDSPDSLVNPIRKGRGRPRKITVDSIHSININESMIETTTISATAASNTNSKDAFLMEQDDDNSLNGYNFTNTCIIDENISNHFYALN